ncbi:MAG: tyrosine-type recombinase/integrase [Clostridiales Family XIII bacterium]|jgi:site-specific recombinase XerD|nr:tyrosine-type recombinase/integrase [Clostridiales Family XIII bacterium]
MVKEIRVHNKSDKPDNIILKEALIEDKCAEAEHCLPRFLRGFFMYLKGGVLPMTRLAYLNDIRFFMNYLVEETDLTEATTPTEIKLDDLRGVKAVDVNLFLDYCRRYKVEGERAVYIYQNDNKSLARKRSSVSVLFKYLYRDELVEKNITDGFDPIRLPKAGDKEIKTLQDDEVMTMLDAVSNGIGLSERELKFWQRTKLRDKAILVLFVTYGLRLSELRELNLSSFNFRRGEFKIYRKRGKESIMPLNRSVTKVLNDYIKGERRPSQESGAGEQDALFLSLRGRRLTERQIRELVKKYTSIAMGTGRREGYSPHKLRATAATSLIERGHSVFDVQELLDHDNVSTTQLYAAHKKHAKRDLVKGMEWETEYERASGEIEIVTDEEAETE